MKSLVFVLTCFLFISQSYGQETDILLSLDGVELSVNALEKEMSDFLGVEAVIAGERATGNLLRYSALLIHGDNVGKTVFLNLAEKTRAKCLIYVDRLHPRVTVAACTYLKDSSEDEIELPHFIHIPISKVEL